MTTQPDRYTHSTEPRFRRLQVSVTEREWALLQEEAATNGEHQINRWAYYRIVKPYCDRLRGSEES